MGTEMKVDTVGLMEYPNTLITSLPYLVDLKVLSGDEAIMVSKSLELLKERLQKQPRNLESSLNFKDPELIKLMHYRAGQVDKVIAES